MAFANFKEDNHEERWKKRETKMYDEVFEDPELDHIIDSLLKFIDQLPQPKVKVVDFERFNTMIQSALNLKKMLAETKSQGQLEIEICEKLNCGSIKTVLDDLVVINPVLFAFTVENADNFEIYPRTDGSIQLNITFQSVLKTVE